jgi:uncharacterized membrane protein
MPTAPIIIPLIIAGLMMGSLLASQTRKFSKRKLLGVSVVAGLLNMANAYLVYTLFPPTTFTRFSGGGFTGGSPGGYQFRGAGAGSEGSFLILSFITGLVIVVAVVGIALVYGRHKVGLSEEETEESKLEEEAEESKLEEEIKET